MITNALLRKYLTLGVIVSFFVTGILPSLSENISSGEQTSGSIPDNGVLDVSYIYNITKALSNIVFTEYDEENGEIARGRAFGTVGEHKAAKILEKNMSDLGLWTWNESIVNLPELPNVASAFWVNDYKIVVKNISSGINKTVEGHIAPTGKGPRGSENKVDYNFTFKDLKFKVMPKYSMPFGKNLRERLNQDDYVYITVDYSFNPYIKSYPIEKVLKKFLSPYSDFTIFYKSVKTALSLATWYNYYPHCQGLVRYDFTNDTYNIVNSVNWLPVIFINGTIGKEIRDDIDNYRIDFYLNQTYNESVTSYNVIGQLNSSINPDKIVLVDCLYDGCWNQATADSAIGMAMVLGIAKWFKDNNVTPKYTIRFIGFGGEEHGIRGAYYYQAVHKDENIIYVIDLNQLGFSQEYPELYLELISNNARFLKDIFEIAKKSNYSDRTGYAGVRKFYMPRGAPSDDQPFARYQKYCKTVCFLKGFNWVLHHRDGANHKKGDVLDYFDPNDVNVTGEIILNVIKYIAV